MSKKTALPLPASLEPLRHLNEHETASLVNLSVKTLRRHRFLRCGIPYYKTGRRVSYALPDIKAWLTQHRVDTNTN
jgi:hypothetical protein